MRPLILLVGPTAVGKTGVAVELAAHLNAEIVSADSRQVYRYMDIGTAKPTAEERARVPHHLLDVVEPDQTLTLAQYQEQAYAALDDITGRGRVPMLVGGTGLYVRAVAEGWTIPRVAPNPALREVLLARAEREGGAALYDELRAADPAAAERIDPRNVRRVVRALEVYYGTGQAFWAQRQRRAPPYDLLWIGLTMPRPALYERADRRIDAMVRAGWAEEVRDLIARGYSLNLPAFSALGYREMAAYVQGQVALQDALAQIRRNTRNFIRHQYAWFRPQDPRLHWFDMSEPCLGSIQELALSFVGSTR